MPYGIIAVSQLSAQDINPLNKFEVDSLRLSDAYMHQYTRSSLVQIMACRLLCAKPLSDPVMTFCQLDSKEHISVKYYLKYFRKYRLRNGGHFVSASMC